MVEVRMEYCCTTTTNVPSLVFIKLLMVLMKHLFTFLMRPVRLDPSPVSVARLAESTGDEHGRSADGILLHNHHKRALLGLHQASYGIDEALVHFSYETSQVGPKPSLCC